MERTDRNLVESKDWFRFSANFLPLKRFLAIGGYTMKVLNSKERLSRLSRMQNVEAKFTIANSDAFRRSALALGFRRAGVLLQRDTFFRVPNGKLKLREEGSRAMLISYARHPTGSLKSSDYTLVPISDPAGLKAALASSLGVFGEVTKRRVLFLRRNIRLHIDRVDGLGTFGEFEAVVGGRNPPAKCRREVEELLGKLGVKLADLIDVSYMDMIVRRKERSWNL